MAVEIRPVRIHEIDRALELIFADAIGMEKHLAHKIDNFKQLALREGYDLSRQIISQRQGEMIYSGLFTLQEGGTAFILTANPAKTHPGDGEVFTAAVQATQRLMQWATAEGGELLQVLLEPQDIDRERLCRRCGFKRLADLIYLTRSLASPAPADTSPAGISWQIYDAKHHELFKSVILQTYHDSLDCPELEGQRDIEDVIKSHRTAGPFEPRWWKILLFDNKPVGVLLMIPLRGTEAMELTYMGLCPEVRGKDLGKVLIKEAISVATASGARRLTLAVDKRNNIAYHLYLRFGFSIFLSRIVFWYSSRWR